MREKDKPFSPAMYAELFRRELRRNALRRTEAGRTSREGLAQIGRAMAGTLPSGLTLPALWASVRFKSRRRPDWQIVDDAIRRSLESLLLLRKHAEAAQLACAWTLLAEWRINAEQLDRAQRMASSSAGRGNVVAPDDPRHVAVIERWRELEREGRAQREIPGRLAQLRVGGITTAKWHRELGRRAGLYPASPRKKKRN